MNPIPETIPTRVMEVIFEELGRPCPEGPLIDRTKDGRLISDADREMIFLGCQEEFFIEIAEVDRKAIRSVEGLIEVVERLVAVKEPKPLRRVRTGSEGRAV